VKQGRWGAFLDEACKVPPKAEPKGERFKAFIERVNPRFQFWPYHKHLIDVAEAVANGEISNLMVWQPPGTSKSEVFSRLLPAWVMSEKPTRHAAICTYGAMLAHGLARDARDYALESGVILDPAQKAKLSWKTLEGGHGWGAGFGGAVRGNRYNVGIVDDPHKDPDQIASDVQRERLFRWWDVTWMNRGFLITDDIVARIIVMQRLADNDLCGWLLGRPDADKWTVLALDAEYSEEPLIPEKSGARLIRDDRKPGELLLPEKLTPEFLRDQKADEDAYFAQFQQRPRVISGQILDPSWFRKCFENQVPPLLSRGMGVDLAVSSRQSADFTVGFPGGLGTDQNIYIFNPYRERSEAPDSRTGIAHLARQRRCSWIAVESVAFQLAFVQELRRMHELVGISVIEADVDRDKVARARGWSHLAKQGRIVLVDDGSGWIQRFLDECKKFPRVKHDDQVDSIGILIKAIGEHVGQAFASGGQRKTLHS
jgi:predicted phage terminase large subunit-like protein